METPEQRRARRSGEVPRSPTGRVPQWVMDEATGRRPEHDVRWRAGPDIPLLDAPRRSRWARIRSVTAVTVLAVVLVSSTQSNRVLGWLGVDARSSSAARNDLPTPGREVQRTPLGQPAAVAVTSEAHRWINTGPDGSPASYDPCRPIHYVTRLQGAPPGGAAAVSSAVAAVSAATGLRFVDDGATDEAPSGQRAPFQPDRYGDRWVPVLIAWVTPAEAPDFASDVAGQAGSLALTGQNGRSVFVTGQIELDRAKFAAILQQPLGAAAARLIVMHELGHLVGLAHVNDPAELMYATTGVALDYGPGDRTGLAELGRGRCTPEV